MDTMQLKVDTLEVWTSMHLEANVHLPLAPALEG